jgi:hypothetical protein
MAEITPAMIEALAYLREELKLTGSSHPVMEAFEMFDNAGIFAAIDEVTGYDVDPAPERVSKCTCPEPGDGSHRHGCPGDPAEYGDLAFR